MCAIITLTGVFRLYFCTRIFLRFVLAANEYAKLKRRRVVRVRVHVHVRVRIRACVRVRACV